LGSTFDLFRRAERIESVAAEIYGVLARRFSGNPDAYALFTQLEAEEQQHAARVRLLAASYRNDSKLLREVNGASELAACLADAEGALAEVRAGGWGRGLTEVLARVARLEDRLVCAHANLLALNGDGALREFFEKLTEMDDAHVELLVRT
jgi:hypothetical protein